MFDSVELQEHMLRSHTVRSGGRVLVEINHNDFENIERIGVYRYRPTERQFGILPQNYDPLDVGKHYTEAEISYDAVGVYEDGPEGSSLALFRQDNSLNHLFSLSDCFRGRRPRSGINKLLYFGGQKIGSGSSVNDPRFYIASNKDYFKYWTSFKRDGNVNRGLSFRVGSRNLIDDAVPFVVYKEPVAANRIVVKMQTKKGESFRVGSTPSFWRMQVLKDQSWETAYMWGEDDISDDGYVELGYGDISEGMQDVVVLGELMTELALPEYPTGNEAYLVRSAGELGTYWVASDDGYGVYWKTVPRRIGWSPVVGLGPSVKNPVRPIISDGIFEEFEYIEGLRIVVESMSEPNQTFDLIEMSPRLSVDVSERTIDYSVTKSMGDVSGTNLPVGKLIASTGKMTLDNSDLALTDPDSLIGNITSQEVRVALYDVSIFGGYEYVVPLKVLYTEPTLGINYGHEGVNFQLRDLYGWLESIPAPDIFMMDVSLSRAVGTLLDYIGFSNYVFNREGEEIILPFFFSDKDSSVAQVLSALAESTQSAMFFDEYNNFVVCDKEYVLSENGRKPSLVLRGHDSDDGLANIVEVSTAEKNIFNSGNISFVERNIQRTYGSIQQSMYNSRGKTWIYSPVLLWEAAGDATTRQMVGGAEQGGYTLSAMPLHKYLSDDVPVVRGGKVINNTINVGNAADYVARYEGYLYANGEVIKYDAVQFFAAGKGNVWVTSGQQYQELLLNLTFGGRLYPTGLLRIWSEPYTVSRPDGTADLVEGAVRAHGRGQFGTKVVSHAAGVRAEWTDTIRGMMQDATTLFNMREDAEYQSGLLQGVSAGTSRMGLSAQVISEGALREGTIKDFLAERFQGESPEGYVGSLQASALVVAGPPIPDSIRARDFVSYIPKKMNNRFTTFGTRCRIVGKLTTDSEMEQIPVGSSAYYTLPSTKPESKTTIEGGSGGIGVGVNPSTNAGYFFEVAALSSPDTASFDIDESQLEVDIGKVVSAKIVDNVVEIEVEVKGTFPELEPYDFIEVSEVYEDDAPDVNGLYRVETVESLGDGKFRIRFLWPLVPHAWIAAFGTAKNASGTDLGQILEASVDDDGVATMSFAMPSGLYVGHKITVEGFDVEKSVADINVTGAEILSSSPDTRIVTFRIPKLNYEYGILVEEEPEEPDEDDEDPDEPEEPEDPFESSFVRRVRSHTPRLSNIWFYKTVADDFGGRITEYEATSSYFEVVVPGHKLSEGDIVRINIPSGQSGYLLNGRHQISYIVGERIRINKATSTGYKGTVPFANANNIGLDKPIATTYKLWSGLANILVDSGLFWGQNRMASEKNTSIYDLAVEYTDTAYGRRFYLFLNDRQIATVVDENPMQMFDHMALFVRGSSKVIFENVYALGKDSVVRSPVGEVFGVSNGIKEVDALRKYAISGIVQESYLAGLHTSGSPAFSLFYDEFGTIMREAAYFNIRFDKAFPALYARISPTLNRLNGYSVGGFMAGAYGAEFMVFNVLDNLCLLDAEFGNFLRINGVSFTQESPSTLSVDDYMKDRIKVGVESGMADPDAHKNIYDKIKMSRARFGEQSFNMSSDFVQSRRQAEDLMGWIIDRSLKKKRNVGVSMFSNPMLQLGDIVTFDYKVDGVDMIAAPEVRFVVYHIEYTRSSSSVQMNVYLSEV